MSHVTDRLSLPLLAAGQAQKHVTHNEALIALDTITHLHIGVRLSAPPAIPVDGQRILVDTPATGLFAGRENQIAVHDAAGWRFQTPKTGWIAILEGSPNLLIFDGIAWNAHQPDRTDRMGINTSADATNRLAVASEATLFTHAGAGCQIKVNKAAPAQTGSLLFQTNWSGRAEMGLNGTDAFSIKSSPDGGQWKEGFSLNATTGAARFPSGIEHATGAPMRNLLFTPGGDGVVSILRYHEPRYANPRAEMIASISGDIITLAASTAAKFFHVLMAGVSYLRMWNTTKVPAQACWIKAIPATNQLQVLDAAALAGWSAGDMIQLGDPTPLVTPTRAFTIDISPMLQNVLGGVFRQSGVMMKVAASATGTSASIAVSGTAEPGSFLAGNSYQNGDYSAQMIIIPTTVQSPISNSNLLFFREDETTFNSLSVTLAAVYGVFS